MRLWMHLILALTLVGCDVLKDETDPDDADDNVWSYDDTGEFDTDNRPEPDTGEDDADVDADGGSDTGEADADADTDADADADGGGPVVGALFVKMTWSIAGDDFDLHLLAPDGELETDTDCYFSNCIVGGATTLDWGVAGYDADNPYLLRDNVMDTGPEETTIDEPAPGIYTVVAHDYTSGAVEEGNSVTVTVYLDGEEAWTDTRSITGEGTYTQFAAIDIEASTVTTLEGEFPGPEDEEE